MKKEIRQKIINYEVFISDDGIEFDNERDALYRDRIFKDEIKECPDCKGRGWNFIESEYDDYHTGVTMTTKETCTCKTCKGKGYLEKKIKVIWE